MGYEGEHQRVNLDVANPPLEFPLEQPAASEDERIAIASPRQLMWWKFRKHRVAVVSLILLIVFYIVAIFADFLSPLRSQCV